MGLSKKKSIKEQLQMAEHVQDIETVSKLKKQLTSLENSRDKLYKRLHELQEQQVVTKFVTVNPKEKGIDGMLSDIRAVVRKKKEVDFEAIEYEVAMLSDWQAEYFSEKFAEITPVTQQLFDEQQEKIREVEQTFETKSNTAEIDAVVIEMQGDCPSLANRLNDLFKMKSMKTNEPLKSGGLLRPSRWSIAQSASFKASQAETETRG